MTFRSKHAADLDPWSLFSKRHTRAEAVIIGTQVKISFFHLLSSLT